MRKIASLVAAAVLLSTASVGLSLAQQAPPAVGAPPAGPGAGAPGRAGVPPATATKFPQGIPSNTADLPDGSHQTNGNPGQGGITGYLPPCPPQNVPLLHHYAFDMFALDTKVDLPETATRADLMKVMDGHILGHDSLVVPHWSPGASPIA